MKVKEVVSHQLHSSYFLFLFFTHPPIHPPILSSPISPSFPPFLIRHHVEQAGFRLTYIAKADFELLLPLLYLLKVGIAKIRNTCHHVFMGYCGSNVGLCSFFLSSLSDELHSRTLILFF